ncbi:MAG: phosphoribosyltransferase family protein [bacterium]|nr:phosphoribosyltransferase family protein [bacterium]
MPIQWGVDAFEVEMLRESIQRFAISHHDSPIRLTAVESNYYCNLRLLSLHPNFASSIGKLLAPAVIRMRPDAVGGKESGAIPVTAALTAAARDMGAVIPSFFVRRESKTHGLKEEKTISASVADDGGPLLRPGCRVVLIEDTVTTASSLLYTAEIVRGEGAEVVGVATVVERHERGGDRIRESGVPFVRLFYTDENGAVRVDEELHKRVR